MSYQKKSLGTLLGKEVRWYDELESTNSMLSELIHAGGCDNGTVIVSDYQTKGRGQRNNGWESERGKNLCFSIAVFPTFLKAEDQFLLSKAVSVGMVDMLATYGIDACIKWANDIYVEDKKVTGILIEHSVMGMYLHASVIGVGLNVNQTTFLSDAPNPVSIAGILGRQLDREEVLGRLLACIANRYQALSRGDVGGIEQVYISKLYRLNGYHRYMSSGVEFDARIAGICNTGELVLEDRAGNQKKYAFKEVSFVL